MGLNVSFTDSAMKSMPPPVEREIRVNHLAIIDILGKRFDNKEHWPDDQE